MKNLKTYFYLIALIGFLISCSIDKFEEPEPPTKASPAYALPLGYANMNVNEYFEGYEFPEGIFDTIGIEYEDQFFIVKEKDLDLNDVLDFNPEEMSFGLNTIEYITFKILMKNGYPTTAFMQLYLVNDSGDILDTLLSQEDKNLPPGTLKGEKEIEPTEVYSTITFKEDRLEQILEVKKIKSIGGIFTETPTEETLKLYEDYAVSVQVGVTIQLYIDTDSMDYNGLIK